MAHRRLGRRERLPQQTAPRRQELPQAGSGANHRVALAGSQGHAQVMAQGVQIAVRAVEWKVLRVIGKMDMEASGVEFHFHRRALGSQATKAHAMPIMTQSGDRADWALQSPGSDREGSFGVVYR